ncbi:unnamed protein product [Diatraea saccharalis]|uniref:unspecific monooxygenase n=1 Tax=Diatraea saccharalis TaxID=40085 RepID=A0A9N9QYQ3_9NEOP|nr:unnamed protein product [Diatraea saccharalis]
MMVLVIWLTVLVVAFTLYLKEKYSKFKRKGVNGPKPIPIIGTGWTVYLGKEHMADYLIRMYQSFPNERFYGNFELLKPLVVVRDIDLIKQITTKDFEYFLDHRSMVEPDIDPLFGRNLVTLKGQEWKDMRSMLSPMFTSSKIRVMVPFMMEVGNQMIESLKKKIKESNENFIDVDSKDLTSRYTNDVIASCAFGLKVNSMVDEDNEFFKMGKIVTNFTPWMLLKVFFYLNMPVIMRILKIKFLPEAASNFFRGIIMGTMEDREKNNIFRPDMIHLMMQARKGRLEHEEKSNSDQDTGFATVEESVVETKTIKKDWSEDDLVAQALLFFLGGFDTVSLGMVFALHELALNPEVQDKLVAEIRENEIKNEGKFDFNSIQKMAYMDMVVSESLRLWTPAVILDRICTKDYNLGKPNDLATQDYIIRKGEGVTLAAWAIHRDPKYFPNPTKFDPERFSEENKHKIVPFSYMPFGLGPRNCIASRFALCELKVMLYQLLLHFEISPCEKTCVPSQLDPTRFTLCLKGGSWIRIKIRE